MAPMPRCCYGLAVSRRVTEREFVVHALSVGNISRSSSLYTREYWFCIEMNGVRLLLIA